MNLFERISLLLRSNLSSLLNRAEEPDKVLDQLMEDMNKEFVEAKKQVALAIADERKLHKQVEKARVEAVEWEGKAMQALKAGKDDLARGAMERKLQFVNEADEYEKLWTQQKNAAGSLRGKLVQLSEKMDEAKRKKGLLAARAQRAEAQMKIQEALGNAGTSSAMSHFERMERKVEELEAEADATELMATPMGLEGEDSMESKFRQLEADGQSAAADVALAELKARMNPGSVAQPKQLEQTEEN